MQPVKIGVIGVGGMGGGHARGMSSIPEAKLVAVADVNAATAEKVAAETGATAFASAEELIEKGGVDAILIATPHFYHPPVAEFAAAHGVHVLTEKPIAVTVSAADRMVAAAEQGNVLLGVMFQQRTEPVRVKMRRILDSGVLGAVTRISMTVPWYRTQAYYDSGAWRGTWKGEGGGILMNQAPHSIDQFAWFGGSPLSVQAIASTRFHKIEVENTAIGIFDYGQGRVGWLYVSTAEVAGNGETVEIACENGMLSLDQRGLRQLVLDEPIPHHLATCPAGFASPEGTWTTVEVEEAPHGHTLVTQQFCRAVQAGDPSLMVATGQDGVRALELTNAMLLAGFSRREVKLPVDRGAIDEMLQRLQNGARAEDFRD